jgi:hypothetical protein
MTKLEFVEGLVKRYLVAGVWVKTFRVDSPYFFLRVGKSPKEKDVGVVTWINDNELELDMDSSVPGYDEATCKTTVVSLLDADDEKLREAFDEVFFAYMKKSV